MTRVRQILLLPFNPAISEFKLRVANQAFSSSLAWHKAGTRKANMTKEDLRYFIEFSGPNCAFLQQQMIAYNTVDLFPIH